MATVRKTITLTDQQDQWVKAQIEAGRFTNDSGRKGATVTIPRRCLESCGPSKFPTQCAGIP